MPVCPALVSVDTLPPEGRTIDLSLSPEEADARFREIGFSEARLLEPLHAEVRVLRSDGDVFVVGRLETRVEYPCVCCLEPFAEGVEGEISATLTPAEEVGGAEIELKREDLDVEEMRDGVVDLGALLIEHLLLTLRTHPVCRGGECKGLCPQCGADLNRVSCECSAETPDPRLAALAAWRRKT